MCETSTHMSRVLVSERHVSASIITREACGRGDSRLDYYHHTLARPRALTYLEYSWNAAAVFRCHARCALRCALRCFHLSVRAYVCVYTHTQTHMHAYRLSCTSYYDLYRIMPERGRKGAAEKTSYCLQDVCMCACVCVCLSLCECVCT